MKKIAMILNTSGIEYDDRIRKEMLTVMNLYPDIKFKIFATIDGDPLRKEEGVSDYGVEYVIPQVPERIKYKQATHLYRKLWGFYKTMRPLVENYDAFWLADLHPSLFVALCQKPMIWDLHETPDAFLHNGFTKILLKHLMRRCKVVIHCNQERLDYLNSIGAISNKDSQYLIRNFPSFDEVPERTDTTFIEFKKWLGDTPCIYLQGAGSLSRYGKESVEAIMATEGVKAVAVGRFEDRLRGEIIGEFGDKLTEKIFFTGQIPQRLTPQYIRECKVSLVLYKNTDPDNLYCEPNRMFQSIVNGCPVVVSSNPTMKNLVEKYGFGVVLPDFKNGVDVSIISDGLRNALQNRETILDNINMNKTQIVWKNQEGVFKKIIEKLFA